MHNVLKADRKYIYIYFLSLGSPKSIIWDKNLGVGSLFLRWFQGAEEDDTGGKEKSKIIRGHNWGCHSGQQAHFNEVPQKHTESSQNWAPTGRRMKHSPCSLPPWGSLLLSSLRHPWPLGSPRAENKDMNYVWNQAENENESQLWTTRPSPGPRWACLPPRYSGRGHFPSHPPCGTVGSRTQTGAWAPTRHVLPHTWLLCWDPQLPLTWWACSAPIEMIEIHSQATTKLKWKETGILCWLCHVWKPGAKARGNLPFFPSNHKKAVLCPRPAYGWALSCWPIPGWQYRMTADCVDCVSLGKLLTFLNLSFLHG